MTMLCGSATHVTIFGKDGAPAEKVPVPCLLDDAHRSTTSVRPLNTVAGCMPLVRRDAILCRRRNTTASGHYLAGWLIVCRHSSPRRSRLKTQALTHRTNYEHESKL
jgi:hypothetical protein